MPAHKIPIIKRFWEKVEIRSKNECWMWIASMRNGRGRLQINKKSVPAPQVAWELTNGKIPIGKIVCHSCDTPACVNPNHLWIGTSFDNMRDMVAKGRWRGGCPKGALVGEKSPVARFTNVQAKAIMCSKKSNVELAIKYGVKPPTIWRIKHGVSYRDARDR